MFVKIKLDQSLPVGTVVQFHDGLSLWVAAPNIGTRMIGVLLEDAVQIDNEWFAPACFSGMCEARADREIPASGGSLHVLNGRVYVDQTIDSCGVIAPLPQGQAAKQVDDLVLIALH